MMIPFNKPPNCGNEQQYVLQAIQSDKISGDGYFSKKCQSWFEEKLVCQKALLTPSCTHALEMAAILIGIQPGDEVIMPSYTFVSTANAFVLRGAKIVFVDIRSDTMNIDETLIEAAITPQTKAILAVHYAGVACDMGSIMDIANRHGVYVIEDAAQGMMSTYNNKLLGTIGHMAAYSFHETKNYTSGGEGGLLIINDECFVERAEIIREKGTNRSQFFRGMVDKYSWVDVGSSYLPSELQSAYLWGQLEMADEINRNRLTTWSLYHEVISPIEQLGQDDLQVIPPGCEHNAHMFYLKLKDLEQRTDFIRFLKNNNIMGAFHYVPLHTAPAGKRYGRFNGIDRVTTEISERLVRLPMWFGMPLSTQEQICNAIVRFFNES